MITGQFKKGTAGSFASNKVPVVNKATSAAEVLFYLKDQAGSFDSISYIYVVEDILCGVLSIQELLSADPNTLIADIMITNVISIEANASQDELVHIALKNELKAVPVVHEQKFVSAVLPHTLLHILRLEYTNDRYKSVGLKVEVHDTYQDLPLRKRVVSRTPWLIIGLGGGVVAALIVDFYAETVAKELLLAAFIPAIVNIGDAIGNQTEMLFVRWLGKKQPFNLFNYLLKEWLVGTFIGLLLGLIIFAGSYLWLQNFNLSLILGLAILATSYVSIGITIILPWCLEKLKVDPAVASGPLATVLCDIGSLAIYLAIATALL